MAKVLMSFVKNGKKVPLGAASSCVVFDQDIYNIDNLSILQAGDSINIGMQSIIDYIDNISKNDWKYSYTDINTENNISFIGHKAGDDKFGWGNSGDIIFYPGSGGATFGTTERSGTDENTYNIASIVNNKQPNSIEVGINNSASIKYNNSARNSVVIGESNTSNHSNVLLVGNNLTSTSDNQLIIGSMNNISNVYVPTYSGSLSSDWSNFESSNKYTFNNENAVFVVADGKQSNGEENSNTLEVFDTSANNEPNAPNSLVHVSGDLMVDGDAHLRNNVYSSGKTYVNDLYVIGNAFLDLDDTGSEENIGAALTKVNTLETSYNAHKHTFSSSVLTLQTEYVSSLIEYGTVNFELPNSSSTSNKAISCSIYKNGVASTNLNDSCLNFNDNNYLETRKGIFTNKNVYKTSSATSKSSIKFLDGGLPFHKVKYYVNIDRDLGVVSFNVNITMCRASLSYGFTGIPQSQYFEQFPMFGFKSSVFDGFNEDFDFVQNSNYFGYYGYLSNMAIGSLSESTAWGRGNGTSPVISVNKGVFHFNQGEDRDSKYGRFIFPTSKDDQITTFGKSGLNLMGGSWGASTISSSISTKSDNNYDYIISIRGSIPCKKSHINKYNLKSNTISLSSITSSVPV